MIPLLSRPRGRSRRGRLMALVAAPVLGLSLIAAVPSPATTTAGTDEAATGPMLDEDFASSPVNAEPVAVTLITGDTVLWQESGDGNAGVVEVEEAPRNYPVYFDKSGTQEDFYVIPSDVMEQVTSGALDMELFNIPGLVRQGLDDESTGGELPVIVTFDEDADAKQLERDANALPAASKAQAVKGIKGAGVKVDRGNAAKFRDTVVGNPAKGKGRGPNTQSGSGSLDGGIDKVLLDRVLEVDLAESVPQIGAPEAWEAGFTGEGVTVAVLDTGVDATHPDLAGQVVSAENFVSDGEPVDDHGHGTHVASTIAGTGAASDGARRGVAPDADLLSGKVCNAEGQCPTSAVMAGMEWAVAQGADVVNMSLGGAPTDGTDPESQLLNELSAETGALFVTSAGNTSCCRRVGSPAAADAALAVGAVDKSDQLAPFSSRGPRVGDHAVKPEITAPGVAIVAARVKGTPVGDLDPVDDFYSRLSGTSMASPHVAGAAALLAQAHPDLGGQELKDVLVSTAADGSLGGTITSGAHEGTIFTMTLATDVPRIDGVISGTPTFVGEACAELDAGEGIALVERGPADDPCTYQEKLDHVTAAGYEAGIVFNNPGAGCMGDQFMLASGSIPFVFVNRLVGLQLLQQPDVTTANACDSPTPEPGSPVASTTIGRGAGPGYLWWEQGAGRVDVPAALDSPVYAQGTLNFGGVDGEAARVLVYTNRSDHDVTLSLDAAVTALAGQETEAAGVTLSTDTLTVPAHGTANVTVTVTLDASTVAGDAVLGGVVTATSSDGVALRTAIGFGPPLHKITIEVLDSNGDRIGTDTADEAPVDLIQDTRDPESVVGRPYLTFGTTEGIAAGHVPAGTYTVVTTVDEREPDAGVGESTRNSLLVKVEVDIITDTRLTLDARDAVLIEQPKVPRKADKRNHKVAVSRELPVPGATYVQTAGGSSSPVYVTPTPPGKLAPLRLAVSWTLAEPQPLIPLPTGAGDRLCPHVPWFCFSETPEYVYNIPFIYENGVPRDLHETVTRRDLVEVPTRFHSDHPDALILQQFQSLLPSFQFSFGTLNDVQMLFRPGAVTEYFLADSRFWWRRQTWVERYTDGRVVQGHGLTSADRFLTAEAGTRRDEERWHEGPSRVGVRETREEALDWSIGITRLAVASRGGSDGDQFTVPFQRIGNTRGHSGQLKDGSPEVSWRMWNTDTGDELERSSSQVFPLAPETATYRLEQTENRLPTAPVLTGRSVTTTWTFTSRPSDAHAPQSYECWLRPFDRCQIQPLILLEYRLGLDIHNRAPAGRAHEFTITAGHHSKVIDRAPVTELSVQASFDDGDTWTDARVVGKPLDTSDTGGFLPSAAPYQQFRVALQIPPLHRTNGFVTLRVQAEDANGGTVDQTTERAYLLKSPGRGPTGKDHSSS